MKVQKLTWPGGTLIIHTPSGWCVYSKFAYGKVTNPLKLYRGKDCVGKFCEHIIAEARHLYESFPEKPMIPPTKSRSTEYKRATKCHICFKPFKLGNRKVRDHCHCSGVNTEELHTQYVIYSIRYHPIFWLYFIISQDTISPDMFIWKLAKHGSKMGVKAKNTEDYISFSVNVEVDKYTDKNREECSKEITLRFIDSIKFMSSSLDSLVNNLAHGGD